MDESLFEIFLALYRFHAKIAIFAAFYLLKLPPELAFRKDNYKPVRMLSVEWVNLT